MSDKGSGMKVTDRRMFTPEGDLREEFSFLEEAATPASIEESAEPSTGAPTTGAPPQEPVAEPAPEQPPAAPEAPASSGPTLELPGMPPGMGRPTFLDLVAMVAEPAAIYLGDAPLPDGTSREDSRMARLHIELLDVMREKCAGNLEMQESAVLEDILYRLRSRYVQKFG